MNRVNCPAKFVFFLYNGGLLRQRLLETCKATADFAIFSGFGWHRRGDPLKSKKIILAKVAIFGMGKFFVFRLILIF